MVYRCDLCGRYRAEPKTKRIIMASYLGSGPIISDQ